MNHFDDEARAAMQHAWSDHLGGDPTPDPDEFKTAPTPDTTGLRELCPAHSSDPLHKAVRTNRRVLGYEPQPCDCELLAAGHRTAAELDARDGDCATGCAPTAACSPACEARYATEPGADRGAPPDGGCPDCGNWPDECAGPPYAPEAGAGDVEAREFNEAELRGADLDLSALRAELIQVTAMAGAWADSIARAREEASRG